MELSPQDRDRIFQEETARRDAQKGLKGEEDAKSMRQGCLFFVGLCVLAGIVGSLTQSKKSDERTVAIGEVSSISTGATCAPTSEALTRIMNSRTTKEEFFRAIGIEARSAGWIGPVFLTPPDRVEVLQKTSSQARVRIVEISGGSSSSMLDENQRECWVPAYAIDR